MECLKEKLLAQVRPDSIETGTGKWQQQKSAGMRVRILETTIDCLVENGYSGLSTNEVTQRAGISRGAMHHHFSSRMALVAAVIEYTFYQRLRHFLDDYFAAIERRPDDSIAAVASDMHWRSVQTREYAAYLELLIAARTDPDLNAHFQPAARRFDKVWSQEMLRSFPQWADHWDALQVANDFAIVAHMGLLLERPVFGKGKRSEAVRDLIAQVIKRLHGEGKLGT